MREYAEQILIHDITFMKTTNEIYLELRPNLSKIEVDRFFAEKKGTVEWWFKPTDRKMLTLQRFNQSTIHRKWVVRAKGCEETVDELIGQLEIDERVHFTRPVYVREDLKYPNGFTYNDQIIIRFDDRVPTKELQTLFREMGVKKVRGRRGDLGKGLMLLRLLGREKQDANEAAQGLATSKIIMSAKVNLIQLHSPLAVIPNDTHFTNQWNLRNTGQMMPDGVVGTVGADISVEPAWDISKGSPLVVIAVLDTGCDLSHDDLLSKFVQRDRMYNAETSSNTPDDDLGHGTCCAGIAASLTNSLSTQGVAGVGWHCRVMPIRMVWNSGYSTSEAAIIDALNWALTNHADIISMSWHWGGTQDDIDTSLEDCFDAGIVLVAAAGNRAVLLPDTINYPASNPHVIAVGATNENDRRCTDADWTGFIYGSQYGPELSVVAPGVHTWSTDMIGLGQGYNNAAGGGDNAGDYTEEFGGTSGATPHVAGLASLMLANNPTLTPTQVRTIIENNADDLVGDPAEDTGGWDKYMGHGRINAHASMVDVQTNHPFSPADVFIRDSLSDTGIEPYIGSPLCKSPDIIIRKAAVANPQAAFADMTVDPGSDNVEIGNDNYIYIRVHNKGTVNSDIHVRVYYAPLTGTCSPDLWEYIGQIDFYDVPTGGNAVSDALVWENVPDPGAVGHFCTIASIEGFGDSHPDPVGISGPAEYMEFIRNHNNICYRNVVFENVFPDTSFTLCFLVPGIIGDKSKFDLRIERKGLALRAKVGLGLHNGLFKAARAYLDNVVERTGEALKGFRFFELKEERRVAIKGLVVPPGSRNVARLEIRMPADARPGEAYQFTVQHVFEGKALGEFHVMGKVFDPRKVEYIAVRGGHLVHRADCKDLAGTDSRLWAPFESLEDARAAGFDMALDCLNQPFKAKDVSYRLARKVLHFINNVELAEDLRRAVESDRLDIPTARMILETRDKVGRFTKLEQLEAMKGVDTDKFIDLVNSFK